jgi:beta-lactamase class A
VIAFVAKDLASGRRLASCDEEQMPAFSTIKVLVAAAFWLAVQRGDIDEALKVEFHPWDSAGGSGVLRGFRHSAHLSLADLAHLMLVVSDNDATNVVLDVLGLEAVNTLAAELDLRHTQIRRRMMDTEAAAAGRDNVTSAADLATLLEILAVGERLGPAVTGPVWASLEKQEHLDGIARYLPARVTYAGKCGDDWPVRRMSHDCALLREGAGRVVVAIMSDGGSGFEPVARLGAALHAALRES